MKKQKFTVDVAYECVKTFTIYAKNEEEAYDKAEQKFEKEFNFDCILNIDVKDNKEIKK